jgi:hypothetical protein
MDIDTEGDPTVVWSSASNVRVACIILLTSENQASHFHKASVDVEDRMEIDG